MTGETVRKYYAIAGQTVAMRTYDPGTTTWLLHYFLTDHLGSVVAVLDDSGEVLSEQRCMPFGQVRTDVGTIAETDFGYTFQRALGSEVGLMDYKVRFYSPYLNRFIQPDSIVPGVGDPQAFNRYSYVVGNPLKYADPTGHRYSDNMDPIEKEIILEMYQQNAGGNNGVVNADAYTGLKELGLFGDDQAAMDYIVATEFGDSLLEVWKENTEARRLFEAMTRHYWQYCKGGKWTPTCVQSFWGYHEGILNVDEMPDFTEDELATIHNISSAIYEPGTPFNGMIADSAWKQGCQDELCHYAQAPNELSIWVEGIGIYYKEDNSYSIDWADPRYLLYKYDHGDEDFVIYNQPLWDFFNLNFPQFLLGGDQSE